MKTIILAGFILGFMVGCLAVQAKNDLALHMSGHDSFAQMAKCVAMGP